MLHLSSEWPPAKIYGLGRFVHALARAQAQAGDEVYVLTNSTGGDEDQVVKDGVRLYRIAFPNPPRPPDGHGEVLQFNHGLIARFLDRIEIFRGIDVIVSHDWLTALAAREIVEELQVPLVVTFHDEVNGKLLGARTAEGEFVRALEALTAHDATHVIANSRFIAQEIVRHYGVSEERVTAVPGGIDPEVVAVGAEHHVQDFRSTLARPEETLILYVGRLDPEKGLGTLAEAALLLSPSHPELRFALAGSGREEATLRKRLEPLGNAARLLGYVGGETLAYLYRSADMVLVPSIYEPFGLVALEAMAAGAPVIAARSGGLPEIVEDGVTGLLFLPGDGRALADAILALAADPERRRELGRRGAARAHAVFAWPEIAKRTRAVYEQAIAARQPACDKAPALPASIVLLAHNGLSYTKKAIEALIANTEPPFELVLVDNGSRDGTRAFFCDLRDRPAPGIAVQVIENDENLGYSKGNNQGIRAARGRHVVVLNNDTEVRRGWLSALLRSTEEEERVGIVTAKILDMDLTVQSAGGIIHRPDGSFEIPHQGEDRLAPPVAERRELENAGGPCVLLTRDLIERVGVFDEAYSPAYFEDSDLCMRAREAGFRLFYEPQAEVLHHGKATTGAIAREGSLDIWGRFEQNKSRFYGRWRRCLEEDERMRCAREAESRLGRKRILLCYNRSDRTTAAYCEAALRLDHAVVTAGRGQEVDLGEGMSAADLVRAAGGEIDLLLVIEGENYFPSELESAPCPTAFWAIDNHIHADREDGWHFRLARSFDHVFIAQRDYLGAFRRRGIEARWLPLACDPHVHVPPRAEKDIEVVFIGHVLPIHRRRRILLDRLERRFRLTRVEGVFREEMASLYARAKIVFNCSLAGDLNMRVFEALASGGLLLTDRIGNGLETFFGDGEHLILYEDGTLDGLVRRSLEDEGAREEIARRGQRLALRHHTYRERMRALVREAVREAPRRLREEAFAR